MPKWSFKDGLKSLLSSLVNTRNAVSANVLTANVVNQVELRAAFRSGLGSKIVRIKNGYALKEPLVFQDPSDKLFYNARLKRHVKKAGSFMIGFGRGVIVINENGADLATPQVGELGPYKLDVFSGDMVTANGVSIDLTDQRYQKPKFFNIRDRSFHYSRVIDFRYVEPPEFDLPLYQWGGVPEFELIYNQMVNDGVIERASASIIEKSSTLFYKIKGFKGALQNKQEADLKSFFSLTEQARSIYGAGLIDSEDDVINIDQKLNNLAETDLISLRRLAMVSGIPFPLFMGESPKGLNATGTVEKQVFNETIETLQQDYYLDPINELLEKLGRPPIEFSDSQNITPVEKIEYETKALTNAKLLWEMGQDHDSYLEDRGIIEKDKFAEIFSIDDDTEEGNKVVSGAVAPSTALNGAQVTALLDIIAQVVSTEGIPKTAAIKIITSAFPISESEAIKMLEDVSEGTIIPDA